MLGSFGKLFAASWPFFTRAHHWLHSLSEPCVASWLHPALVGFSAASSDSHWLFPDSLPAVHLYRVSAWPCLPSEPLQGSLSQLPPFCYFLTNSQAFSLQCMPGCSSSHPLADSGCCGIVVPALLSLLCRKGRVGKNSVGSLSPLHTSLPVKISRGDWAYLHMYQCTIFTAY